MLSKFIVVKVENLISPLSQETPQVPVEYSESTFILTVRVDVSVLMINMTVDVYYSNCDWNGQKLYNAR